MTAEDVKAALQAYVKPESAALLGRFFKTGEGQYGAGDVFIGVRVPDTRLVCKKYKNLPLKEVEELLKSPVHEHRLAAVILLSSQYACSLTKILHHPHRAFGLNTNYRNLLLQRYCHGSLRVVCQLLAVTAIRKTEPVKIAASNDKVHVADPRLTAARGCKLHYSCPVDILGIHGASSLFAVMYFLFTAGCKRSTEYRSIVRGIVAA